MALRTLLVVVLVLAVDARADSAQEIWKAKCKSCHGEDGSANTTVGKKEKISDMRAPAWQAKWADDDIRQVIAEGSRDNKKMKPFKDKLSGDEIDGLVKHIRGLRVGAVAVVVVAAPVPSADTPVMVRDRAAHQAAELARPSPSPQTLDKRAEPRPTLGQTGSVPTPSPSAPRVVAAAPQPAPTEEPSVKVRVKVTEVEPAPESASALLSPLWLSIAAVCVSLLALVVALKRRR